MSLLWYLWFRVSLQRRVREILGWIETALEHHGAIRSVEPVSASKFRVSLFLSSGLFRAPMLTVTLVPRELLFSWLWHKLKHRRETVVFQADLENRPSFNLEVENFRWKKGTTRQPELSRYETHSVGALIMTTREQWDASSMVDALLLSRTCDFLHVSLRRRSPHLRAIIDLESLRPGTTPGTEMFDLLRELATGASASA